MLYSDRIDTPWVHFGIPWVHLGIFQLTDIVEEVIPVIPCIPFLEIKITKKER